MHVVLRLRKRKEPLVQALVSHGYHARLESAMPAHWAEDSY